MSYEEKKSHNKEVQQSCLVAAQSHWKKTCGYRKGKPRNINRIEKIAIISPLHTSDKHLAMSWTLSRIEIKELTVLKFRHAYICSSVEGWAVVAANGGMRRLDEALVCSVSSAIAAGKNPIFKVIYPLVLLSIYVFTCLPAYHCSFYPLIPVSVFFTALSSSSWLIVHDPLLQISEKRWYF